MIRAWKILAVLGVWLLATVVALGAAAKKKLPPFDVQTEQLRAVFDQFPLLQPISSGQATPKFQTLNLDKPVVIGGVNYYGFRFTVPMRKNHEDLVWAFISPGVDYLWSFLPQTGTNYGFVDFNFAPRTEFAGLEGLYPVAAKIVNYQRRLGDSLTDGETYLIWFGFLEKEPARISLEFTFAPPAGQDNWEATKKALGLHPPPGPDAKLQAVFAQFPLLQPATNNLGEPAFKNLPLTKPVVIDGKNYFGFRFTVPARKKHEDFIWAFLGPNVVYTWSILRAKDAMDGFPTYNSEPRTNYVGLETLTPATGKLLIVQRYPGAGLDDGTTYLVWFNFTGKEPPRMSIEFTFAGPEKPEAWTAMETALGLRHL